MEKGRNGADVIPFPAGKRSEAAASAGVDFDAWYHGEAIRADATKAQPRPEAVR